MRFLHDEKGAITVDWVVLTAGLVGLGLAVSAAVSPGVDRGAEQIRAVLAMAGSTADAATLTAENGTFTFNIGDVAGTFVHDGTGSIVANGDALWMDEGFANNGTHGIAFDEPVLATNVTFTSVNRQNRVGVFRATLEDGSEVDIPFETLSNGTDHRNNGHGAGANSPLDVEHQVGGDTLYSSSGGQAGFTVHLNHETVQGMSSSNRITGFSYRQESTRDNDSLTMGIRVEGTV